MFVVATSLLVFFITLVLVYNWQKHNYWKSKDVPTFSVLPIIGNSIQLFTGCRWTNLDKMYRKAKSKGCWGTYLGFKPELMVCDPELLRDILVKDADHFIDRRPMKFSGEDEAFNEMLTVVEGEEWKALRSIVTPTFTSGKIKSMFPMIGLKVDELLNECHHQVQENGFVDVNTLFRYYTMDVIATCAFGIDAHCIENKESSMFIKCGKYLASFDFMRLIKFILLMVSPKLYSFLGIQVSNKHADFLIKVVNDTTEMRKKSNTRRGDFLDLLLDALEESKAKEDSSKYPMSMNTVIGQSLLFLLAGFDTTSNTLNFLSYLLAKNPEKLKILRNELEKIVECDGELTYQNVMEAQYLDCCLSETLRVYSPAHFLERNCTKPYKFKKIDVEIPAKTMVGIPSWSIHHDEEYWDEPFAFKPERFFPENKGNIKPYTYMPFGLGPRNCVGMRFAQLEAKLAIAKMVLNFEVELRPGFDIQLMNTVTTIRPDDNGVQLVLKKIK